MHRYAMRVAVAAAVAVSVSLNAQEARLLAPPPQTVVPKAASPRATADRTVAAEGRYVLPPLDESQQKRTSFSFDKRARIGTVRPFPFALTGLDVGRMASGGPALLEITSTGALRTRLHFTQFALPEGARMTICSRSVADDCYGPYSGAGPLGDGEFWTPPIAGESVVVELDFPHGPRPRLPFAIDLVGHIFDDPVALLRGIEPNAGACNLPVPSGWAGTARAVGGLDFISGPDAMFCTGTLLNTQNDDFTPYFLTANHCLSTQSEAQSLRIWWHYDSAGQSLSSSPRSDVATLLATRDEPTGSDYTLLMILGALPRSVSWAGWTTAMPPLGTNVVGLHHPRGGEPADAWKRYATGGVGSTCPCTSFSFNCANYVTADWYSNGGTTEPGSSGSGLWRSDLAGGPHLIGQLWGGCAACGNSADDHYGRFDVSYAHMSNFASPHFLSSGTDDAFEQNDSLGAPVSIGSGSYNNLVVKWGDEDYYRVVLNPNASLTANFSFTHAYGDTDVELYVNGVFTAGSGGTSNSEQIVYTNNTGTTVQAVLAVYLFDGTRNRYNMTLSATAPTTVTITATVPTAAEGGGNGSATVSRTGSTAAALSVNYSLGGSAVNGSDYSGLTRAVTIPAGSVSATIPIIPINDSLIEGNETVLITLAAGGGYVVGSPSSATITIADNDFAVVTIAATSPNASENGTNGAATVSRTGPTTGALSVNYALGGSAVNGSDYSGLTGSVLIASGSASAVIPVIPINDSVAEGNETVVIALAASGGYSVGSPSSATVTIADNDPAVVTINTTAGTASESGANGNASVTRTGPTTSALAVSYTLSGTASNGSDYSGLTGSVTIPAGAASANIPVIPINDSTIEGTETVVITLGGGAYLIGNPSSATVNILDNDLPVVTISATAATASENGANGNARVTRSGSTAASLIVYYSLGGTALNGNDYSGLSGAVTIPAGSSFADIPIIPVNDTAVEGNETVVINLVTRGGFTIGSPSGATITIVDNDSALPTITITATDPTAIEGSGDTAVFQVRRLGSTTGNLSVFYSIGGTATNGVDYPQLSGSIGFASGQGLVSIILSASADAVNDSGETVTLAISANAGYTIGSPSSATATIVQPGPRRTRFDFNGDNRSDILWRDGQAARNAIWLMNGPAIATSAYIPSSAGAWQAAATGDFDGDGKADILWRDPNNGTNAIWYMNGTVLRASYYIAPADSSWSVVGAGDVNGDGRDEVLWSRTDGNTAVWFINVNAVRGEVILFMPSGWSARTVGDFDGDGKADLALQNNASGQTAVWLLNGSVVRSSAYLPTAPPDWRIRHAGDFDGDGKQDLMLRNPNTGQNAIWFLNGTFVRSSAYIPSLASGWVVEGTGDFNGDGRDDLLWRLVGGTQSAVWLMNGAAATGHYLPATAASWFIAGRR